jgi:hypothetical protein
MRCPGCCSYGVMVSFVVLFHKRVVLVFRDIILYNKYILFMTFDYL